MAHPTNPTTRLPGGIGFRLENARAGEAYSQPLLPVPGNAPAVLFDEIVIDPGLGLVADTAAGRVSGTPASAGEYRIAVKYRLAGQTAPPRLAVVTLFVNANPRSMWRTLPSDSGDAYWKPDEECGMLHGSAFRLLGASKRGRSHAHTGLFRDDDYRLAHTGASDWHVAVVADGAGSARYSRRGAELVCAVALRHLEQRLEGGTGRRIDQAVADKAEAALRQALCAALGGAAAEAVAALHRACTEGPVAAHLKDFSSTALIAICKPYASGTLCAAYQAGDGVIGAYSKTNGITLLGDADTGEYAGETSFLGEASVTEDELVRRIRFAMVDDLTALVLMTDGVSDPQFETASRLADAPTWHALWSELERAAGLRNADGAEQKLLAWLDFWSTGNHDDRTIAIIHRQEHDEQG